jgi:hypothetical protein
LKFENRSENNQEQYNHSGVTDHALESDALDDIGQTQKEMHRHLDSLGRDNMLIFGRI